VLQPASGERLLRWVIVLAGTGQVIGILVFFANMWPRIRSAGARARASLGL
jgi:hypothetical protein